MSFIKTSSATKRVTAHTKGATYLRTKQTKTTLHITRFSATTGSETDRLKKRFGGAWVRLSAADGTQVGESQELHPEIEKLKPAWTGSKSGEEAIPIPEGFEFLQELAEKIREKVEEKIKEGPPKINGGPSKGKGPGRPPFFPK